MQDVKIKTKSQLVKYVGMLNPNIKVRVLTDKTDSRSQGHEVAICSQGPDGKLTFLKGAPTLTMAANFYRNELFPVESQTAVTQ